MYALRFTRRGPECRLLAPDKGAPAGGGEAKAPASTRGVTIAERASRSAQERDLSPQNESIVPSIGDIAKHLDTAGIDFSGKPAEAKAERAARNAESAEVADAIPDETAPEPEPPQEEQPEPEPEVETPADGQPEPEEPQEEQEPEAEQEESFDKEGKFKLPPEVQESINKRIGEITREKSELKQEVATLTAERDQLKALTAQAAGEPVRLAPMPHDPLADVTTQNDLHERVREANETKLWAIQNANGVEVVTDAKTGATEFYDPDRVRSILVASERILAAAPQRAQFLQLQQSAADIGRKAYPEHYRPGTPENQQLQQIRRALPWLATLPDADLIIADAMAGKRLREGRMQPSARTPAQPLHKLPTPKPAPRLPAAMVAQKQNGRGLMESRGSQKSVVAFAESLVS